MSSADASCITDVLLLQVSKLPRPNGHVCPNLCLGVHHLRTNMSIRLPTYISC